MRDVESALSALGALRALGLHLAIDDFGTGYSSMAYLERLPVESLKIDRSFVAGVGRRSDSSAIATAIVSLAHALRLKTVAEGIEQPGNSSGCARLAASSGRAFSSGPRAPPSSTVRTRSSRCGCDAARPRKWPDQPESLRAGISSASSDGIRVWATAAAARRSPAWFSAPTQPCAANAGRCSSGSRRSNGSPPCSARRTLVRRPSRTASARRTHHRRRGGTSPRRAASRAQDRRRQAACSTPPRGGDRRPGRLPSGFPARTEPRARGRRACRPTSTWR